MASASELITQLYTGYFDRAPDPAGLNYWISQFNAGLSLLEIAQSFSVQAETRSSYSFLAVPSVGSADGFLDSVYRNLFNRTIDAEGLNYWKGELAAGKQVGRVIVDIISGAQGADKIIVDNKTIVGQFYVTRLADTPGETFHLNEARQVLDGVNASAASVLSAQALTTSLLTSSLTLNFNDSSGVLAPFEAAMRQSIHVAWNLWEAHFTRTAPIEIEVNMMPSAPSTLASARSFVTQTTGELFQGKRVLQVGVGFELATGTDPNGAAPDGEISLGSDLSRFVFRTALSEPIPRDKFDAISIFAHEIGHILGFNANPSLSGSFIGSFERFITTGVTSFNGPSAMAANGGVPVLLDPNSLSHLADATDLMAARITNGQERLVEPLHIAILQDTGLPVTLLGVDTLV